MFPNNFTHQLPFHYFPITPSQNSQITTQLYHQPYFYCFNNLYQHPISEHNFQNQSQIFDIHHPHFLSSSQFQRQLNPQTQKCEISKQKPTPEKKQQEKSQIQKQSQKTPQIILGCICSKTGCVKDYCRCFKTGKSCSQECRCHQCKNVVKKEEQFAKKIKSNKFVKCNCKKSKCSNKYCDCLVAGRNCGKECNCCDCSNH